ncbi:hypothetical protein [Streptomyces sp. NPDC002403]
MLLDLHAEINCRLTRHPVPPVNRVLTARVFKIEASHEDEHEGTGNMEEVAGSAVVRVLKGVSWLVFNVVGAVGEVLATHTPWNRRSGRSSRGR